jgi:DNA-binding transcriptional LysR family regulator
VRSGALQIVLQEFEPPPIPVHVVHAEGRHAPARVRAFVDFAVARLRAESWLT